MSERSVPLVCKRSVPLVGKRSATQVCKRSEPLVYKRSAPLVCDGVKAVGTAGVRAVGTARTTSARSVFIACALRGEESCAASRGRTPRHAEWRSKRCEQNPLRKRRRPTLHCRMSARSTTILQCSKFVPSLSNACAAAVAILAACWQLRCARTRDS